MRHFSLIAALMLTALACAEAESYLSPADLAVAPDGNTALVVNRTGQCILQISLPEGKVLKSLSLKQPPSAITLSSDGARAYVTAGIADGELLVIDTSSLKPENTVALRHTPVAPTLSPDGKTLYVCNRMNNSIAVIDTDSLKITAAIPTAREPVALTITPDGKLLFVANHLPAGKSNADHVSCEISVIDTEQRRVVKSITLVNGAESLRGIQVSPDGKYVYATHLVARFLVPTTQIERGWINTSALSIVRVSDQTLLSTILLDDVDMGFANPWGIAINDDGSLMAVASAGTHEISLIDLKALMSKVEELASKPAAQSDSSNLNAYNDLAFLSGLRTRVQLKGIGPREIVMHNNTIYAVEYFTDSIARVVVRDGRPEEVSSIPLGPRRPLTPARRGEILFNDATMCFQKWQSCASCHPDVRADGLNWDLLNDGIGNPKNAKSLILSHKTPPVMALGVRTKAEVAVRAGIKYIQFAVRPEEDAEAVDAYLLGLEPDPSPRLVKGELSKAAQRGKDIFKDSGCIGCHPAPYYTDMNKYDVGTGTGQDTGKMFDVPTLREVWRTAPYMHDGGAATIYEVIKLHNPYDKRGKTSSLTEDQINDLAEYVESL